jgi:hypothetical protein
MTAAHLAGRHDLIDQLMTELCEVIEANEPFDQLQPETLQLHENLSSQAAISRSPLR